MYMSSRALYTLFVQLESVSSSAQSRGLEVKFQGFAVTSPVSNNTEQTDVAFGAGALGSGGSMSFYDMAAVPTGASGENPASLFWFWLYAS